MGLLKSCAGTARRLLRQGFDHGPVRRPATRMAPLRSVPLCCWQAVGCK